MVDEKITLAKFKFSDQATAEVFLANEHINKFVLKQIKDGVCFIWMSQEINKLSLNGL